MNRDQKDFHTMVRSVHRLLTENAALTATPPALVRAKTALLTEEARLNAARRRQGDGLAGVAAQKDALQEQMITAVLPIAGQLQAWASETQNLILLTQSRVTLSGLQRLTDKDSADECAALLETAQANKLALIDYGFNDDAFDAAEDLVEEFSSQVGAPRSARIRSKSATAEIAQAITQLRTLLEDRLDALMRQFENAPDPALAGFYADYQNARIIVNTGTRSPEDEADAPPPAPPSPAT